MRRAVYVWKKLHVIVRHKKPYTTYKCRTDMCIHDKADLCGRLVGLLLRSTSFLANVAYTQTVSIIRTTISGIKHTGCLL